MKTKIEYWLQYTNGKTIIFLADDPVHAAWIFQMEGDHAYTYGRMSDLSKKEQHKIRTNLYE